jgi:hypothetical protein
MDQQVLVHGGFLFLPLSIVLQTSVYLGYLQTFLYYPYYFWILELFVCGFSILCLPFFLLRQKWGVFLFLDKDCILNRSNVFFVPKWPKGEFVSLLATFC